MSFERPIRVLLIEDDPADAELVRRQLARLYDRQPCELRWETELQAGLQRLAEAPADIVLLDLALPDSRGISTLARLRESSDVPVVVFTVSGDMDGALRALDVGAQDYLVKDELAGPSALLRSIRYAIERARIAHEKQASLGVLSAGVAMGFNQLFGTILEAAEQATRELTELRGSDRARRRLTEVRRAALRGGRMAGQLRDYAAGAPLVPHPVDVSDVVRDDSELIRSLVSPSVAVTYSLASDPAIVTAGRLQLHQILLALVHNAAEAVGEGPGVVSISTGFSELDARTLRESQGSPNLRIGRYVSLSVADTGRGMDPQTRARIFDPFFTTKAAGRGLGLAAALGVARQCQAAIRVETSPGKGSQFDVLFPLQAGTAPWAPAGAAPSRAAGGLPHGPSTG